MISRAPFSAALAWAALAPFALAALPAPTTPPPAPYGALPSAAQLRHIELEQYAFVHFTLNTFTGKEWGFGDERPALMNPTAFDADQIVGALKSAGLRGVILTCKHHDGFCLWPSATTGHTVAQSPFRAGKGDLVREIEQAARKSGLKFGVYVSPWDRNSGLYGTPAYVTEVFRRQLREVLTGYGEICEVWFDGANGGDGHYAGAGGKRAIDRATYYGWQDTWRMVRELRPEACIFSDVGPDLRWIGNESGYAKDPCWGTYTPHGPDGAEASAAPGQTRYREGEHGTRHGKFWIHPEVNVSIRPGWFWHAHENTKVRTPAQLWKVRMDSVGLGGTFLLNVPPDRRGLVHENDAASLAAYGRTVAATYARNLAADAAFHTASVRAGDPGRGPARLVDDDRWSAWMTDDADLAPSVELTLPEPRTFNHIRLREDIRLGQRVEGVAVDAWLDGAWKPVATARSVGACRLWDIAPVTTDRLRLRVTASPVCPALSDFGLYLRPALPELDFRAARRTGDRTGWSATATASAAGAGPEAAIDGDPKTLWHTHAATGESGLPQALTLNLGRVRTLRGVTVTPRADGVAHGLVDRYRVETSADGARWTTAAEGEFSNIRANPVEQTVLFSQPVSARLIRLTALRAVEKNHASFAEIGVID